MLNAQYSDKPTLQSGAHEVLMSRHKSSVTARSIIHNFGKYFCYISTRLELKTQTVKFQTKTKNQWQKTKTETLKIGSETS